MSNRLITLDELAASLSAKIKKQAGGDPWKEMMCWAALGAAINGPDSPAADLLEQLAEDA